MELIDVRRNYKRRVIYDDCEYILLNCIEWIDNDNKYQYSAELKNITHNNSIVRASIFDIKVKEVEE